MSELRKLIAQLEAEDEQRKKDDEKHFEEQYKKWEEMQIKMTSLKDDSKRCMDNITKGLDHLIANRHTIEQAVKQTENLTGLPIPLDQHGNIIDLVSIMTKFMNNEELSNNQSTVSASKIHQDVVSVAQNVSDELQKTRSEFVDGQTLYDKIRNLKELSTNDSFAEETKDFNLSDSVF